MSLLDMFRKGRRQDEPPAEWWQRIARVEADMKQLELQWESTYDKVRRALATLAKRQQREEQGEHPQEASSEAPLSVALPNPSDYAKLRQIYGRR